MGRANEIYPQAEQRSNRGVAANGAGRDHPAHDEFTWAGRTQTRNEIKRRNSKTAAAEGAFRCGNLECDVTSRTRSTSAAQDARLCTTVASSARGSTGAGAAATTTRVANKVAAEAAASVPPN